MKNCAVKSSALVLLVLMFALVAPINEEGQFGLSPVYAAEEKSEKKQKTRRVPSLSESVYKKLGEGQEAIDAKDYNLAQEIIQGALDRSRRYNENEIANLHNMLGYIYYLKDDYNGAIREYKIVVNQGEKIPEGLEVTTLYTLAQLSYVQENYDDALYYMEVWITKATNPSSAPRFFLATVYYQMKDYDKAVEQMELGVQIAQERNTTITEQNWSLLTFLYFEKEDWTNVIRVLKILVEEFPKREHWIRLAGVYGQEGFEKEQLYTLEAAYTADFLEKQTDFTNLAGLLMQEEVPYRAAKVLEDGLNRKAVERDAKNLQSLGQAWQLAQEVDKAIPVFEEAAGLADDGKIYERLSYLYLESDQYDKCVDSATGALDKGGLRKDQSVYIVKGMCLFNQNKLTPARTAFVSCRRVARQDKDTANQRICGQWITFIDRESKRQAQLAAASGE
ncbi:MAG: tetratricopeptide repeat protein [Pseudomonadota bacterium]|nr:tetratricopeptide repeat protein [Pseudomonadota bacterium]MEC7780124.1 tetratricopeptide repeat protein [Pseudomonadota bacterium]MEC8695919.1 tetratricopeptide repeat protein [Pseudomonadota bacterium]MEE3173936.1 tetratricopeptide repeat protein [Pseudomonadota bacterium]